MFVAAARCRIVDVAAAAAAAALRCDWRFRGGFTAARDSARAGARTTNGSTSGRVPNPTAPLSTLRPLRPQEPVGPREARVKAVREVEPRVRTEEVRRRAVVRKLGKVRKSERKAKGERRLMLYISPL